MKVLSSMLVGTFLLLPIQAMANIDHNNDTVRGICMMAGKDMIANDVMPNVEVTCYSKIFKQKKYENLQAMFADGWEPISVGVGQGEAATSYRNEPYNYHANIYNDTLQSLGIVVEKVVN
ncbi:MAG: hypothetical protein ACPGUD_01965 [Parashewanella sp.]